MTKIIIILTTLFITLQATSVESNTSTIPYYIYNAASKFELDVSLLYAICKVESNCKAKAINHSDGTPEQKAQGKVIKSYGLFQLQLATVEMLGFVVKEIVIEDRIRKGKHIKVKKIVDHTSDLLKPEINTWYAAKLLKKHYNRYHSTTKAISAYNAGHYIRANKEYVNKVLTIYSVLKLDKRF